MASLIRVAKLKNLWRTGWIEIPETMASSCLALLGIAMSVSGYFWIESHGGWSKKYMTKPMVMRPDDPRVLKIRHDSHLDN